jgi:hypothetical protein
MVSINVNKKKSGQIKVNRSKKSKLNKYNTKTDTALKHKKQNKSKKSAKHTSIFTQHEINAFFLNAHKKKIKKLNLNKNKNEEVQKFWCIPYLNGETPFDILKYNEKVRKQIYAKKLKSNYLFS